MRESVRIIVHRGRGLREVKEYIVRVHLINATVEELKR